MNTPTNLASHHSQTTSAPLWRLMVATGQVVQAVRAGRSMTAELEAVSAELRPGVQALSFHVMRQLGRAMALRALLATKAPPPAADALLCTALALVWDEQSAPYPVHTLVNQVVEAAQQQRQTRPQSGFINACLRRFMREREVLVARTENEPQAQWNHPHWWVERLQLDHPAQWQTLLSMAQKPAPMTLRVHQGHHTVTAYQTQLKAQGITSRPVGLYGLQLDKAVPVQQLPGFAQGHVSVQDAAAQLAAPLLLADFDLEKPLRILDACAAPGGKQVTCWSSVRRREWWRWMWTLHVVSAFIRTCYAWVFRQTSEQQMRDNLLPGGMVRHLMPSCLMRLARHRALCAGIPMCGGCAGPQTVRNWPRYKHNC